MLEYVEGGENEEAIYRRIELTQYLILVSPAWALWATHIWRETTAHRSQILAHHSRENSLSS